MYTSPSATAAVEIERRIFVKCHRRPVCVMSPRFVASIA
jgi:hypothetical protein